MSAHRFMRLPPAGFSYGPAKTGRRLPRRTHWLLLALLAGGVLSGGAAGARAGDTPAAIRTDAVLTVRALIGRVLPAQAGAFDCELIAAADGREVYEYEAAPAGRVTLRGNSGVALAVAFNQYLRREARLDYDWLADAPLALPGALPPPAAKVRGTCVVPERFFLNYCTYGYTFPWWGWDQWQRFIDWMAMNGVNRPLLQAGQEAVWLRVWQQYGMTADEVRAYFSGPAHLPWHRMANLDSWGGPLPLSYIAGQQALQQQILARARELGMKPILSGFAGHVPRALARLRPAAKITPLQPGWSGMAPGYSTWFLDPQDPLFAEIQGRFLQEQTALYGTDHLYAADPFNEITPPSWDAAYLAGVAASIYHGLAAVDPAACWYQMTWTFTYEKLGRHWTPERLAAMLHAVPAGRMVLLDYAGEEREFYRQSDNCYGLPFIWNYLGNFGGNTHLAASLRKNARLAAAAQLAPNCIGVGSTLEGLGANPVAYELVLEQPWQERGAVDVPAWITRYAERRAGCRDPAVAAAWTELADQVLVDNSPRAGTNGSIFQAMPELGSWHGRRQNTKADYRPEALVQALARLFEAGPEARAADGYRYDAVNFTRQALCNLGLDIHQRLRAALAVKDMAAFKREAARFLALGRDLDELLGTRREFLLGPWLAQAREWGRSPAEADYYEANARQILTSWHQPGGELTDYASRQWNGLLRTYYLPRWEKWVELSIQALEQGGPFPEPDYVAWVNAECARWIGSHGENFPVVPQGDPVTTAHRLFEKYRAELAASAALRP